MPLRSSLSLLATTLCAFGAGIATPTPTSTPPRPAPTLSATPEIDTGGFFLYEPPYADLAARSRKGVLAWTGEQWDSPQWNLVGFAHFEEDSGSYQGSYWLARSDITGGAVELSAMFRPGTAQRSMKFGAPILYIPDPHAATKVMSESEFIAYVNALLPTGVEVEASSSNAAFQLFAVTEELQPGS